LAKDEEWGDPIEFDIEIAATGEKLERKYTVVPKPKKPLSTEDKKLVQDCDWDVKELTKQKEPEPKDPFDD
jgi:hypothetical protein